MSNVIIKILRLKEVLIFLLDFLIEDFLEMQQPNLSTSWKSQLKTLMLPMHITSSSDKTYGFLGKCNKKNKNQAFKCLYTWDTLTLIGRQNQTNISSLLSPLENTTLILFEQTRIPLTKMFCSKLMNWMEDFLNAVNIYFLYHSS